MKQIYVTERNTMARENACRDLTKRGIFQTKYSSYPAADSTNKKRNAEVINNHLTQEHRIVGWSNSYVIQCHVLASYEQQTRVQSEASELGRGLNKIDSHFLEISYLEFNSEF